MDFLLDFFHLLYNRTTPPSLLTVRVPKMSTPRPHRILLCATGSVAAVKIPQLAVALSKRHQVRVVFTKSAEHFVFNVSRTYDPTSWQAEHKWTDILQAREYLHNKSTSPVVYVEEDEWKYANLGDPVLHIELRKWADVLVVAPASANTIAKLAHGLCDNLLTCVARAWDPKDPFLVCPAMNTLMWEHPFTRQHLEVLKGLQYTVVDPVVKTLACGDTGQGAMASVETVVAAVEAAVKGGRGLPQGSGKEEESGT